MVKVFFLSAFLIFSFSLNGFIYERFLNDWIQLIKYDDEIVKIQSESQKITIIQNAFLGKLLMLDGIVQFTEKDQHIYSEMIVHIPLITHSNPKKILILGTKMGGGVLREVLRHKVVECIDLIEKDIDLIKACEIYFPSQSQGAFRHPKVTLHIKDENAFLDQYEKRYDIIIFNTDKLNNPSQLFYDKCKKHLNPDGILIGQINPSFPLSRHIQDSYRKRKSLFKNALFYLFSIPTSLGNPWLIGLSSNELNDLNLQYFRSRLKSIEGDFRYYTPELHLATFVIPKYIRQIYQETNHEN